MCSLLDSRLFIDALRILSCEKWKDDYEWCYEKGVEQAYVAVTDFMLLLEYFAGGTEGNHDTSQLG
jgi:hypothetical protein